VPYGRTCLAFSSCRGGMWRFDPIEVLKLAKSSAPTTKLTFQGAFVIERPNAEGPKRAEDQLKNLRPHGSAGRSTGFLSRRSKVCDLSRSPC
jgi:hypothetical protein